MAYLAPIQAQASKPLTLVAEVPSSSPRLIVEPDLTPLEWSVVRLARGDGLSTLREPGRLRRFANWLLGRTGSPELANPRLEALRRMAVLSWHFGFTVPGEEVADFLAAGFSLEQYELLVMRVRAAISAPSHRIH